MDSRLGDVQKFMMASTTAIRKEIDTLTESVAEQAARLNALESGGGVKAKKGLRGKGKKKKKSGDDELLDADAADAEERDDELKVRY